MQRQLVYLLLVLAALGGVIYYSYFAPPEASSVASTPKSSKLIAQTKVDISATILGNEVSDNIRGIRLFRANKLLLDARYIDGEWFGFIEGSNEGMPLQKTSLINLVRGINDADIIEKKSANPKHHARLGLLGVDEPQSQSTLLTIATAENKLDILLGNEAELQNGQFVRFVDEDQMLLIDKVISVPSDTYAWFAKNLFTLMTDDVTRIERRDSDEVLWVLENDLNKVEASALNTNNLRFEGQHFTLTGLKSNEKLAFPMVIGNYVATLLKLSFDRFAPITSMNMKNYSLLTSISVKTKDNQSYVLKVFTSLPSNNDNVLPIPSEYLVTINGSGITYANNQWVFTLPSNQIEGILKNRDDFLSAKK